MASKAPVVGTVTLIYGHHTRLPPEKLADLQHQHHEIVVSALHAHLDHHTRLEVVLPGGRSRNVQQLADKLISTKGVRHGLLVISSPDTGSPHAHPDHSSLLDQVPICPAHFPNFKLPTDSTRYRESPTLPAAGIPDEN